MCVLRKVLVVLFCLLWFWFVFFFFFFFFPSFFQKDFAFQRTLWYEKKNEKQVNQVNVAPTQQAAKDISIGK